MSAKLRNVSRAQRSTSEAKWCAADTDLGFTRDRRLNVSKSGKPDLRGSSQSVAVPDQRRTAPVRFALHRIRDHLASLAPYAEAGTHEHRSVFHGSRL